MVFVGIGANLSSPTYGAPLEACQAAVEALRGIEGIEVAQISRWYRSEPVPVSDQPWYINGVVEIETELSADNLLQKFHDIEEAFGRVRTVVNAPRIIDIDLLDYKGEIKEQGLAILPHPRLQGRAFVLKPLWDIAADWIHPSSGKNIRDLIKKIPKDQLCEPIVD